jgi:hypothetical protein
MFDLPRLFSFQNLNKRGENIFHLMARDPNNTLIMRLLEGESELLLDVDTVSFRPPLSSMPVQMLTSKKVVRAYTNREFVKHLRNSGSSNLSGEQKSITPPVLKHLPVRVDVTPNTKSETVSRKQFPNSEKSEHTPRFFAGEDSEHIRYEVARERTTSSMYQSLLFQNEITCRRKLADILKVFPDEWHSRAGLMREVEEQRFKEALLKQSRDARKTKTVPSLPCMVTRKFPFASGGDPNDDSKILRHLVHLALMKNSPEVLRMIAGEIINNQRIPSAAVYLDQFESECQFMNQEARGTGGVLHSKLLRLCILDKLCDQRNAFQTS